MSIGKKLTTLVGPTLADQQTNAPSTWVSEMHAHFMQTGSYRIQDVQRVLGDPRQGVEIRPADELPWSRVSKK
jgi:hypothetical protein